MKWFRETLSKNRVFILAFLAVQLFYMTDGRQLVYAHQLHEQKEARLQEISEFLDIPVESLRPDHETLLGQFKTLLSDDEDPVKAAGLKRLQQTLREHEAEVAANPYRAKIDRVKGQYALHRIEGVVHDLVELSSPRSAGVASPGLEKALLRNLRQAFAEGGLTLPSPQGLPAKARSKHAALQAELDRLFDSVRPLLAEEPGAVAAKLGRLDLGGAPEVKRARRGPRFTDRPLPLERREQKARTREVSATELAAPAPSPAVSRAASRPQAPAKDAIAPEVAALAASLDNSPARIFRQVYDSIEVDPKWGAFRTPAATLQEGHGTSWDQAWLLRDLLVAAGVDARFEWGRVRISGEQLTNLAGLDDPFRAGDLLTTAGLPIVLLTQGSRVIAADMSHVWVKAFLDYVPNRGVTPGPGDTWVRLDPSLKDHEFAAGIPVHEDVPFALGDYLGSGAAFSPRRSYEDALWAHIRANDIACTTLEQLKPAASIVAEGFPFVPGTLRSKILQVAGETAAGSDAPPAQQQAQLTLDVRTVGGAQLALWSSPWPALGSALVEVAWTGATADDQAVLDSHGGVFATPPYLVDLAPVVRVGGAVQVTGGAVGSAEDVEIFVTVTPPDGAVVTQVRHDALAGERHVLALDFGQLPQATINAHAEALAAARGAGDADAAEAELLYLVGANYMHDLGRDLADLSGWTWQRLVQAGTEAMVAQTGSATTTVDGTPLTFERGSIFIDVATMPLGVFAVDGTGDHLVSSFELFGAQGSYLEGTVFGHLLATSGIAAVSALTRSQRAGQALTRVDSSNVAAVLAAADLGAGVEQEVQSAVARGKIAWVAESRITVDDWQGTGYVLEDPATGAAGYLLTGGFAGGSTTKKSASEVSSLIDNLLGTEMFQNETALSNFLDTVIGALIFKVGEFLENLESNMGEPINVASANMWRTENDLMIVARGLPVIWSRTYNSRSTYQGPFGPGWTFDYGEHLEELVDGSQLWREHDGTEHRFEGDGAGGFVAPPGRSEELTAVAAGFELRDKFGKVTTFGADGRLLSWADPHGNTITLTYDGAGQLATVLDAGGRTVLTVTHTDGLITTVEDLTGRQLKFFYTGGLLTSFQDLAGKTHSYAYDDDANMVSLTDPLGAVHSYSYDVQDRCYRYVDPEGNAQSYAYLEGAGETARTVVVTDARGFDRVFEYDERGRIKRSVDPLGNVTQLTWDGDNNLTKLVDSRGGETIQTWDDNNNLLTHKDPSGALTTVTYDPVYNRPVTITDPSLEVITQTWTGGVLTREERNQNGVPVVRSFTYDPLGQLETVTNENLGETTTYAWDAVTGGLDFVEDPLNNRTDYTLDVLGRVETVTDALDNEISLALDDADRVVSMTDPFLNTITVGYDDGGFMKDVTTPLGTKSFDYDLAGRLVSSVDQLGAESTMEYDAVGNAIAQTDTRGNRVATTYDALNRPIASIDGLARTWTMGFCQDAGGGSMGAFCTMTDPQGKTIRREIDALGRIVSITDSLNNSVHLTWDDLGRITETVDPLQRVRKYEWDGLGNLTAAVEPDTSRTEYTYDSEGRLLTITDAETHTTSFEYDLAGRLEKETDPIGERTFTYDKLGNLETMTDAENQLRTFTWDVDRLTQVELPGGVIESFTYDSFGRLRGMSNSEVTLAYEYDERGRLSLADNQTLGQQISYEYDNRGNLEQRTGLGGTTEYLYDAANRLVEQRDPTSGVYRFTYDAAGQRHETHYPNGVVSRWSYDDAGRLIDGVSHDAAEQLIDGFHYEYDDAGRVTSKNVLAGGAASHTYTYDLLGRLERWERDDGRFIAYTYDDVGNRETATDELGVTGYTYDAGDRLTSSARTFDAGGSVTTSNTWDNNGNLLSTHVGGGAATTFGYDALDRLTQVSVPGGDVFTYGYDSAGTRVRSTHQAAGGAVSTERFLHDMDDILAVFDDGGTLVEQLTYGPRVDEPLARVRGGDTSYLLRDALGSVTAATDATGAVAGRLDHSPFGGVETASGLATRYGYAGREIDPTGLSYNRARYYQPESGRFLTRDPLRGSTRNPGSLNRYAYVQNNPISFTDPQGTLQGLVIIGFWLGIVYIASNMAYDLQAHYGNFWLEKGQSKSKGYWDSVSARVQPALGQLGMTKVPNEFIWADDQELSYPQRWHTTLLYLVVGLLYFMLTTTTPGITNTPGLQDDLWTELNNFLQKNLSKAALAKIGWIATYYAAYSVEIWLLGVYAFDEW